MYFFVDVENKCIIPYCKKKFFKKIIYKIKVIKKFKSIFVILGIVGMIFLPKVSYAYPVFAQNAYQNPREATGRIVCANCHLAQ